MSSFGQAPPEGKMYLSNEAEVRRDFIQDGFLIVACDGIWDEMTSKDAVHRVGRLLINSHKGEGFNVASRFIEETLELAAQRIAETFEEEAGMSYTKLVRRAPGKQSKVRSG